MRVKVLLIFTTLVALASTASVSLEDLEFKEWKLKHGKIYKSVKEEFQRKMTWLENRKLVLKHNMLADQGIKSYRLGMTYFADMDNKEYRESVLKGCLTSLNRTKKHRAANFFSRQAGGAVLPDTVDWRKKGYVTEVKDQKNCNSCWAFSATGSLEGQIFKKTGKLVSLSEQQLVDCSKREHGNMGCEGGMIDWAFQYIIDNNGIDTEESYPYEARDKDCRFNPTTVGATCTKFVAVEGEDALQEAVAIIGPISVAIDSTHCSFQLYESGIYNELLCSSTDVTHAALVVGYGKGGSGSSLSTTDYWLVKNSWGTAWGENGYIRMSRNKSNQCGIATQAIYPVV